MLWVIVCHWLHWLLALWMAWVLGWPIRSLSCTDPAARSKIMPQTLGLSWKISSESPKNQVHGCLLYGNVQRQKTQGKNGSEIAPLWVRDQLNGVEFYSLESPNMTFLFSVHVLRTSCKCCPYESWTSPIRPEGALHQFMNKTYNFISLFHTDE